jgi:hypothetical protein
MDLAASMEKNSLNAYIRACKHWLSNLYNAVKHFPRFLTAFYYSKPASLESMDSRLRICYACDDLDLITEQCTECWCFIRLKIRWKDESCPKGKWASET